MTIFLMLFCGVGVFLWLDNYKNAAGPGENEEVVVLIPAGASFSAIADILADAGLIYPDVRFKILGRVHGLADKLQAGEFRLSGGSLPLEILEKLSRAEIVQHPVTVVEGLTAQAVAKLFAAGGWCDEMEFLRLVHDQDFISSLGLEGVSSLEGYLFPDTYFLTRIPAFDAEKILKTMVNRFFHVWDSLEPEGVNLHKVVTLASIVEKETGAEHERSVIASVFLNRLEKGMRLQSDPTVIYGRDGAIGPITKTDLKAATPYNTYVIKGLPPGPISNPGKASLQAVLHPADEDYLYFVSKNDGTHHFSRTLAEHNRAVYQYQRKMKE
ncbi:MAG: endolytic transglycosylase MltG [Desulfopila sp.]|nr:endolytic transglycosylase MltG [Desulfopila sp.]